MNTLQVTDEELNILNEIVGSAKTTAPAKDILAITMGQAQSPVLSLTYKVMSSWQARLEELKVEEELKKAEATQADLGPPNVG
jgi:hypothetical protein